MILTTESGTKYMVNDMKLTRLSEIKPGVRDWRDEHKAAIPIIGCPIVEMTDPEVGTRWVVAYRCIELDETGTLRTSPITKIDYQEGR